MKNFILFFLVLISVSSKAQGKKIEILSTDEMTVNKDRFPGATILIGNVKIAHEGATLDCKRALLYKETNLFKAVGEVVLEQGDSIIQYSDFASYNGNTKIAKAWGHVEANDKTMKITTDTLYFNRINQQLYYPSGGTIRDKTNTLKSKRGTYFIRENKFSAKTNVTVTNPKNNLESNHLDYYTNSNLAYLYGPSTITNKKDSTTIYTEKGFYNSNTQVSYFVKNTKLSFKGGRTISADSMYYDKSKGFASATNNIKVIDTINKMITKGNYAELFEHKDSLFIKDRAVGITLIEKDSMFIHGDKIVVTGKPKNRIVRTYNNVKIFKSDLQGKCDSIFSSELTGLTKMFKKPVLWSKNSQITGDSIQFMSDKKTQKLDSLFVYKNAFMIQKDSIIDDDFNQIKGRDMFGKFENNTIKNLLVKGNAEMLVHKRNEKTRVLETITKKIASTFEFIFVENEIEIIKSAKKTEGKTYPPSKFPETKKRFNGFLWRENERPKNKEDIFIKDRTKPTSDKKETPEYNKKVIERSKRQLEKENRKKKFR